MKTSEQMVREFMVKHGQFKNGIPDARIPQDVKLLRMRLINEELGELSVAIHENNIVQIADGLADLEYVVVGTAIAYGIPHNLILEEVHRSNMSKAPLNENQKGGKVGKDGYSPVDLEAILRAHGALL